MDLPEKRERRKTLDDFWFILLTETYRKRAFPVKPCAQKKSVGGVKKEFAAGAQVPPWGAGGKNTKDRRVSGAAFGF